MKHYVYNNSTFSVKGLLTGSKLALISEEEILDRHWVNWKTSQENFDPNSPYYSTQACIDDWVSNNSAYEVSADYDDWMWSKVNDQEELREHTFKYLVEEGINKGSHTTWYSVVEPLLEAAYEAGQNSILTTARLAAKENKLDLLKALLNDK